MYVVISSLVVSSRIVSCPAVAGWPKAKLYHSCETEKHDIQMRDLAKLARTVQIKFHFLRKVTKVTFKLVLVFFTLEPFEISLGVF
jgi:hypothetical protein